MASGAAAQNDRKLVVEVEAFLDHIWNRMFTSTVEYRHQRSAGRQ